MCIQFKKCNTTYDEMSGQCIFKYIYTTYSALLNIL